MNWLGIIGIIGVACGCAAIIFSTISLLLPYFHAREEKKRREIMKSAEIYVSPIEVSRKRHHGE